MSSIQKLLLLLSRLIRLGLRGPHDVQHVLGIALHEAGQIADPKGDVRKVPAVPVAQLLAGGDSRVHFRTRSLLAGVADAARQGEGRL